MKIGAEKSQSETKEQTARLTTGPTRSSWVHHPIAESRVQAGSQGCSREGAQVPSIWTLQGQERPFKLMNKAGTRREKPGMSKLKLVIKQVPTHERSLPG